MAKYDILASPSPVLIHFFQKTPANEEQVNEPFSQIPPIVLAMGANFVEAVTDVEHLSRKLDDFDYVVIREHNTDIVRGYS